MCLHAVRCVHALLLRKNIAINNKGWVLKLVGGFIGVRVGVSKTLQLKGLIQILNNPNKEKIFQVTG